MKNVAGRRWGGEGHFFTLQSSFCILPSRREALSQYGTYKLKNVIIHTSTPGSVEIFPEFVFLSK